MADPIDPRGWQGRAWDWLFAQGVSTVLLCAILAALAYCGNYAVKTAIPAHLKQIQDGYLDAAKEHKETVKDLNSSHERAVQKVTDAFDKEMQWHRDHRTATKISP